jgi:hypothetical protein
MMQRVFSLLLSRIDPFYPPKIGIFVNQKPLSNLDYACVTEAVLVCESPPPK